MVLETSGAEVEIDKRLVEELSDPLCTWSATPSTTASSRPASARAAASPGTGRILLSAEQLGTRVVLALTDDGGGIDWARVREVAIQRGLLDAERASATGERELQPSSSCPGFSTASAVSAMSGRGVGLDVVKNNLGACRASSTWGASRGGHRLPSTLPVTLAMVRGLLVGVSGRVYAVPLNSVLDVLAQTAQSSRTVERRGGAGARQTLPVCGWRRRSACPAVPRVVCTWWWWAWRSSGWASPSTRCTASRTSSPSPWAAAGPVPGISGAADLGNRRTVLVLDVGRCSTRCCAGRRCWWRRMSQEPLSLEALLGALSLPGRTRRPAASASSRPRAWRRTARRAWTSCSSSPSVSEPSSTGWRWAR